MIKNTPHNYFKIKAILTSVSFSLNDLFLHFKFQEHLLLAYTEEIRKISMHNSTYKDKLLNNLEMLRGKYYKCSIAIVIAIIHFILSADYFLRGQWSANIMTQREYTRYV